MPPSASNRPNRPLYSPKSSNANLHNLTTGSFDLLVVDETSMGGRKESGSNNEVGQNLAKIPSYKNLIERNSSKEIISQIEDE